jgi:hypothetical protein
MAGQPRTGPSTPADTGGWDDAHFGEGFPALGKMLSAWGVA